MPCAKTRIRRCVPASWKVPKVARKKSAKKKAVRVASPRAKPKNAAKKRSKAASAAANRGAVQASARRRAELRIVVWARNGMQARGFGREDVTVQPVTGAQGTEVAVQIARREGSRRSLVAIVDAAYHVLNTIRNDRFDGQGRVLELRDRAGIYVKNWRKAVVARKKTVQRRAAIKRHEAVNQSYLQDYVARALEPIGSMRGFDAHLYARSGNRKIRIRVQGPSEPHLHKSTQTVFDKAAAIVDREIAPKFGGFALPHWNPYDVEWSVAGTWPQAIQKWKDAAQKRDKPVRRAGSARVEKKIEKRRVAAVGAKSRKPKTNREATQVILADWRNRGWIVAPQHKTPYAQHREQNVRVYFKPQTIYLAARGGALSTASTTQLSPKDYWDKPAILSGDMLTAARMELDE